MVQDTPYDFTTLLMVASNVIVSNIQNRLDKIGFADIRPAHGFVFLRLSHGGATGQELAQYLDISKQATSQLVEYLEQRGYVRRQPSAEDARNKIVELTDKGWQCIEATETVLKGLQAEWSALLGQERLETLQQDLQKIVLSANGGTMPNKLSPTP